MVFHFASSAGPLRLVVLFADGCPTIAAWWLGDVLLGLCRGGLA